MVIFVVAADTVFDQDGLDFRHVRIVDWRLSHGRAGVQARHEEGPSTKQEQESLGGGWIEVMAARVHRSAFFGY